MSTDFDHVGRIQWSVETDATVGGAQALTRMDGWGQGGRLGTELVGNYDQALRAATILRRDHDGKTWMSPTRDREAQGAAKAGLDMYNAARTGLVGFVHAALESGMTPEQIAKRSGLSLEEVNGIIHRHDLERLVAGE